MKSLLPKALLAGLGGLTLTGLAWFNGPARAQGEAAQGKGAAVAPAPRDGQKTDAAKPAQPDPAHQARVTTKVPCADYFAVRDRALIAHATQIDPEGSWFTVPLDVHQEAWPTEDFELVRSEVPTSVPEDDLFAGIAVPVADDAAAGRLGR